MLTFDNLCFIMKCMKKYIFRSVKLIALIMAVLISALFLQNYVLCHLDHNKVRIDGFYLEDKNSLDVVFTGASELYTGFSPGLAYEKFGFTSYPYATASVTAGAALTQVKEIQRTQNPKLIVIEINPFIYPDDSNETNEGSIRKYIDCVPLNENKIEYIEELNPEHKEEYYFPLIKYHSCWDEYPGGLKYLGTLIQQHFRGYTLLKGYKSNIGKCGYDEEYLNKQLVTDNTEASLTEFSEQKLRELLQYGKDNNIKMLFFRAPHLEREVDYESFCMSNRAGKIINSYGFDFINFERDPVTMGYTPDLFYNVQHLNAYGSAKFTEYFGKILVDNYGIGKSELTDAQKRNWEEAVDYYHQFYKCCDDLLKERPVGTPSIINEEHPELNTDVIEIAEDMDGTAIIKAHNE